MPLRFFHILGVLARDFSQENLGFDVLRLQATRRVR